MRILLTNDDGINAPGLRMLAKFAMTLGDVLVVAPNEQQSAKSQSIEIHKPFEVKKSDAFDDLGIDSYSVNSTPADCVRFAVDQFGDFDFVFSGINPGMNLGLDVSYSATCGAAFEANYWGISSMAVSADLGCLEVASAMLPSIWSYVTERSLFSHNKMYNVNIPASPKGILLTKQGGPFYRDNFFHLGNDLYEARYHVEERDPNALDLTVDTDAILAGYCSISPLQTNRTNLQVFEALS